MHTHHTEPATMFSVIVCKFLEGFEQTYSGHEAIVPHICLDIISGSEH